LFNFNLPRKSLFLVSNFLQNIERTLKLVQWNLRFLINLCTKSNFNPIRHISRLPILCFSKEIPSSSSSKQILFYLLLHSSKLKFSYYYHCKTNKKWPCVPTTFLNQNRKKKVSFWNMFQKIITLSFDPKPSSLTTHTIKFIIKNLYTRNPFTNYKYV